MSHLVLTQKTIEEAILYWLKKHASMSALQFSGVVDFVDFSGKKLSEVTAHVDLKRKQ